MLNVDPVDRDKEGRWIVVADGDENAGSLLAGYLAHQRFRAYPTRRGTEALRIARAHPLGLAVVDVVLEDMAGRDLIRLLRGLVPELPVVMTSGDVRPEVEVEARQLGIVQYLHKPFDFRRLEAVAARTLAATRARAARAAPPSREVTP